MTNDWKPLPCRDDGRYTAKSRDILIMLAEELPLTLDGQPAALRISNCTDGMGSMGDCYGYWAIIYDKQEPRFKSTHTWAEIDRYFRQNMRTEFSRFVFVRSKEESGD